MSDEAVTTGARHSAEHRKRCKKKSNDNLKREETNKAPSSTQNTSQPIPEKPGQPAPHTPKIKIPSSLAGNDKKETPSLIRKKPVEPPQDQEARKPLLEKKKTPFDQDQVVEAWEAFKKARLEADATDTEKLVLDRTLKKTDENDVTILLESQLETSILEKFEPDLIRHLRQSLDNTVIQLKKVVSEQESTKGLYTSREKFEYMAEQNPVLRELKDRLGLDFEY